MCVKGRGRLPATHVSPLDALLPAEAERAATQRPPAAAAACFCSWCSRGAAAAAPLHPSRVRETPAAEADARQRCCCCCCCCRADGLAAARALGCMARCMVSIEVALRSRCCAGPAVREEGRVWQRSVTRRLGLARGGGVRAMSREGGCLAAAPLANSWPGAVCGRHTCPLARQVHVQEASPLASAPSLTRPPTSPSFLSPGICLQIMYTTFLSEACIHTSLCGTKCVPLSVGQSACGTLCAVSVD
eukprot:365024-Chlamydomonas_euryale.AAC.1